MKGLYKAVTEAARLHDRHNVGLTYARADMIAFIYGIEADGLREMVEEAVEVLAGSQGDQDTNR